MGVAVDDMMTPKLRVDDRGWVWILVWGWRGKIGNGERRVEVGLGEGRGWAAEGFSAKEWWWRGMTPVMNTIGGQPLDRLLWPMIGFLQQVEFLSTAYYERVRSPQATLLKRRNKLVVALVTGGMSMMSGQGETAEAAGQGASARKLCVAGNLVAYAVLHVGQHAVVVWGEQHYRHEDDYKPSWWRRGDDGSPATVLAADALQRFAAAHPAVRVHCVLEGVTEYVEDTMVASEYSDEPHPRGASASVGAAEAEKKDAGHEPAWREDCVTPQVCYDPGYPVLPREVRPTDLIVDKGLRVFGLAAFHSMAEAAVVLQPEVLSTACSAAAPRPHPLLQAFHNHMPKNLVLHSVEVREHYAGNAWVYGHAVITRCKELVMTSTLRQPQRLQVLQVLVRLTRFLQCAEVWKALGWVDAAPQAQRSRLYAVTLELETLRYLLQHVLQPGASPTTLFAAMGFQHALTLVLLLKELGFTLREFRHGFPSFPGDGGAGGVEMQPPPEIQELRLEGLAVGAGSAWLPPAVAAAAATGKDEVARLSSQPYVFTREDDDALRESVASVLLREPLPVTSRRLGWVVDPAAPPAAFASEDGLLVLYPLPEGPPVSDVTAFSDAFPFMGNVVAAAASVQCTLDYTDVPELAAHVPACVRSSTMVRDPWRLAGYNDGSASAAIAEVLAFQARQPKHRYARGIAMLRDLQAAWPSSECAAPALGRCWVLLRDLLRTVVVRRGDEGATRRSGEGAAPSTVLVLLPPNVTAGATLPVMTAMFAAMSETYGEGHIAAAVEGGVGGGVQGLAVSTSPLLDMAPTPDPATLKATALHRLHARWRR